MIKRTLKRNGYLYTFLVNKFEILFLAFRRIKSFRFRFLPIESNKIVFDNFAGKGYGGNPMYIAKALLEQQCNYDLVWLVNDLNTPMPKGIRKVKINSLEAYDEILTAKILVDNVKDSLKPKKRKGQYYIQTWHGAVALKTIERDAKDSLPKSYLRKTKRDSKEIDLFIAETKMSRESLNNLFWYDGEVAEASFNKYSFDFDTKKQGVIDCFGLVRETKIILYAPTFRKDGSLDCYNIDYERLLITFERAYGGNWIVIIRLHPVISRLCKTIQYNSRVLNGTYYNSVEALIAASEAIITDFSSCMFDAYKLEKKVYLYASDYEEYVRSDRRLYFDLDSMPSPMCTSMDELIYAIENMNDSDYEKKRKKLIDEIGFYENDAASFCCERIVRITGENNGGNIKERQ